MQQLISSFLHMFKFPHFLQPRLPFHTHTHYLHTTPCLWHEGGIQTPGGLLYTCAASTLGVYVKVGIGEEWCDDWSWLWAKAGCQGLHLSHTPALTKCTPALTFLGPTPHIHVALFCHRVDAGQMLIYSSLCDAWWLLLHILINGKYLVGDHSPVSLCAGQITHKSLGVM